MAKSQTIQSNYMNTIITFKLLLFMFVPLAIACKLPSYLTFINRIKVELFGIAFIEEVNHIITEIAELSRGKILSRVSWTRYPSTMLNFLEFFPV